MPFIDATAEAEAARARELLAAGDAPAALAERHDAIVADFTGVEWSDATDARDALPLVANDEPSVLARVRAAG